jgi:hypothetical protein
MPVFDESHHPIIGVRWTGERTVDDADRFFSHCDGLLQQVRARGQQLALINVSNVDTASPEVRRRPARRRLRRHRPARRRDLHVRQRLRRRRRRGCGCRSPGGADVAPFLGLLIVLCRRRP